MPTLKQLRYLEALARHGHFGRAAADCSVTQPALSMQIRELEAELGAILIERLPGGARLTGVGAEVAARGTRLLRDVRDLADVARGAAGALGGNLALGVIPSVAPYLLPPLLPLVREAHPDLQLRIRESQTLSIVSELLDGTLDLLLLALPIDYREIETVTLFEDPFVLAVPNGFEVGRHVRVTPDLIGKERVLLLEEGHCFREQALAFCQLRKVGNIDTYGASTLATVVQMVAGGMGVTLLPRLAVPVEGRNPGISLHDFQPPAPSRQIGLAWRRTSPRKAQFEAMGALISRANEGLLNAPEER
ncbi:MAG: hydrogen peroxide-inducible genes activator [Paracoccaceae bacterium]